MIDHSVQSLLEEAIDTPVKLQLLLLFHENPWMEATPSQVAQRACRDIWSTLEALRELTDVGILRVAQNDESDEPVYRYSPTPHRTEVICRLAHYYEDPLKRDLVHRSVRELASYAPFRRDTGWFAQLA